VSANNRVYDGGVTATLNLSNAGFTNKLSADSLTIGTYTASFSDKTVGAAKAVSVSNMTLGGADAGNYQLSVSATTLSLTADITPKAISITGISSVDRTYNQNKDVALNQATAVFNGAAVGDVLLALGGNGTMANADAGTGKLVTITGLSLAGADAANYTLSSNASTSTVNIARAPLSLSGATGLTKVYDGTTALPGGATAYGALGGVLTGDVVELSGLARFDSKDGGQRAVQVGTLALTGSSAHNYTLNWTDGSGTITKKALTVTANNDARFVTQTEPSGYNGVSYTGLVAGETGSVLGGTLSFTRQQGVEFNSAGNYTLTPSGLTSSNYEISYVDGTYTIVAANRLLIKTANETQTFGSIISLAPTSVQYLAADSRLYDLTQATTSSGEYTYTYNDGAGGSFTFRLGAVGPMSNSGNLTVGNYDVTATTFTQTGRANVDPGGPVYVGKLTIAPKLVQASVTAPTKMYDGTTAASTSAVSLSGVLTNDVVAPTAGPDGSFSGPDAGTNRAYSYSGLALSGVDAANYYLASNTLTGNDGVITPRVLSISGSNAAARTYDGTTNATVSVGTLSGFVTGQTVTAAVQSAVFDSANAGMQTATVSYSLANGTGGGLASNYTLAGDRLSALITPKELILGTATVDGKVYDGTTAATITPGTVSGVLSGESIAVAATGSFRSANAGLQTADFTYTLTGGGNTLATNYTLPSFTGSADATITAKALSFSTPTSVVGRVYDGTTTATASLGSLTGFVSGDSVTAGIQSALFDSANAGTRQATVTYSLSGNGATNYSLASDVLTAAITPKALNWATDSTAVSRAYDGTRDASVILGSLAGFVGTEEVTASVQSALYTSANAGTTSASVSYALADGANGGLASNYTLASNLVNGLITAKALSISGTSAASRQYDGTMAASITPGQLAGLVGNETLGVTATGTFANANVVGVQAVTGTYQLVDGSGLASNYSLANPTGLQASITERVLTISGSQAVERSYDGTTNAAVNPEHPQQRGGW